MRYVSTRGEAAPIGFLDAVLAGLAPDGGLYVPAEWPTFTKAEIAAFAGKPYAQVAAAVVGKFVGDDIPPKTWPRCARRPIRPSPTPPSFR
jgi:threonine synthase